MHGTGVQVGLELLPEHTGSWQLILNGSPLDLASGAYISLQPADTIAIRQTAGFSALRRAASSVSELEAHNYPNPFNATTTIWFTLEEPGDVRLTIHDLVGQRVATLVDGQLRRGRHWATWDGRDEAGRSLANGVYLYQLHTGSRRLVNKMLLLK